MRHSFFLVAVPLFAAFCSTAFAPRQDKEGRLGPLTGEGSALRETLTLRDSQDGFAGSSGTVTTIEPSGAWRLSRFLNETTRPPHREGRLTEDRLAKLAGALATLDLPSLPRRMGPEVPVNPRTLTVALGAHTSTLVLKGGESLSPATVPEGVAVPPEEWRRFTGIVQAILDVTGQDAEKPKPSP